MSSGSSEQRHQAPQTDPVIVAVVASILGLLAWPPLLLGVILRLMLKHREFPLIVWFLVGFLGLGGLWLIIAHTGYIRSFQTMTKAILPSTRWSWNGAVQFAIHYMTPLWLDSLLVTPLCAALLELLLPKSLEERLLAQDRDEQAKHERATKRAKRKLQRLPAHIKEQAVIGVVVKSPK